MTHPACKDCKWSDGFGPTRCRRNPPQSIRRHDGSQTWAAWPLVQPYDWCGEFQPPPRRRQERDDVLA